MPPSSLVRSLSRIPYDSRVSLVLREGPPVQGQYLGQVGGRDSTDYALLYERWRQALGLVGAPRLGARLLLAADRGDTLRGTYRGLTTGMIALEAADPRLLMPARLRRLRSIEDDEGGRWAADSAARAWDGAPTVSAVVAQVGGDTLLVPMGSITVVRDAEGKDYTVPRTMAAGVVLAPIVLALCVLALIAYFKSVGKKVKPVIE